MKYLLDTCAISDFIKGLISIYKICRGERPFAPTCFDSKEQVLLFCFHSIYCKLNSTNITTTISTISTRSSSSSASHST